MNLLRLPINPKINPHYYNVKDISNQWVIDSKLVYGIEEKFVEWDIPLYTSLAYTNCSLEKLRPLCDYFSWLFLIDDIAEKLEPDNVWKLFKGTLEIIEFDHTNESDIWSITFADIWKRMKWSNNITRYILLESKKEYIQGVINQKTINYFNINTYIKNRTMDVGANILSTLLLYAYDIEIEKNLTDTLSYTMGICFGIANDIYSFKNEESYNIVNVIMKEKNVSADKALKISISILQSNIYALVKMCNMNNYINKIYLDGLKLIITGTIVWTNNNPRYNYRENINNKLYTFTKIKNYKYNNNIKNKLIMIELKSKFVEKFNKIITFLKLI